MGLKANILNDESLLKHFLENSPDLFWIISPDLKRIFYLSPNFEKVYGFKREELVSPQDWLSKIVFYKDKQKPAEGIKKIISSFSPERFDYRIKLKDGSVKWVRDFAFPIKLENEVYIAGITRDITNIKMHEKRRDLRHELSHILYNADTLSIVMPKILATICSAFEWKIGIFWILDQCIEHLHFFSSWHCGEKDLNAFETKSRELSFAKGDFFVGKSMIEQKALLQRAIIDIPEFSRSSYAKLAGIRDGCVFPIILKNTVLGVLEFFTDEIEEIDHYTLDFFTDLGTFIGNFIEKLRTKEELKTSEELFRNAFNCSMIGMALTNIEGSFQEVNLSLCEMLGLTKNELLRKNYKNLIHPDDLAKNSNAINQTVGGIIPSFQTSARILSKSNNYIWVVLSASLIRDINGLPLNIIFQIQDISYIQSLKEKLLQLAQYDVVTRLPNRQLLEHTLQQSLLVTSLSTKKAVIFVIDIDRSKLMNEPLNQEITDKLLLEIGQRLNLLIKIKDIIARLEGGEFAILISDIFHEQDVQHALNLIFEAIKSPFFIDERQFYVTASIGASIFPDDAAHAHELVNKAYIAMNAAKKKGGNSYSFFSQEMLHEEQEKLKIEFNLRDAIEKNELSLVSQPIFELTTGIATSAEVLLRWNSNTLGEVTPSKFIPIAERTGQIVEIGKWVLKNAAQLAKNMRDEGIPPITLAINLSPRQLADDQFYDYLIDVCEDLKIDHKQFRFEITETQLIENFHLVSSFISRLKEACFECAIDDFGVGYSSFSYLKNFVADRIKIDFSFVHNLNSEPKCAVITAAIVAMCQKLGIIPIAEGVETQNELDYLKSIGCAEGQGFFLSYPLRQKDFFDFLKINLCKK